MWVEAEDCRAMWTKAEGCSYRLVRRLVIIGYDRNVSG